VNVCAALRTINQASYDALASSSLELCQANQVIPEALLRKHQTSHLPIDLIIDTLLGAGESKGNTKASHQLLNQVNIRKS
jgi:NAD(P)H-hydrate repair Nnr-like enzyme with NAD(P)H-hydrate epimerase domain